MQGQYSATGADTASLQEPIPVAGFPSATSRTTSPATVTWANPDGGSTVIPLERMTEFQQMFLFFYGSVSSIGQLRENDQAPASKGYFFSECSALKQCARVDSQTEFESAGKRKGQQQPQGRLQCSSSEAASASHCFALDVSPLAEAAPIIAVSLLSTARTCSERSAAKAFYSTTGTTTTAADFTVEQVPAGVLRRTLTVGQVPTDINISESVRVR